MLKAVGLVHLHPKRLLGEAKQICNLLVLLGVGDRSFSSSSAMFRITSILCGVVIVLSAVGAQGTWWQTTSIYQIYPRSFQDSDGDGIGDLPGITSRLEYLAELGVEGVWLSPIYKSPMKDFGYDISDYMDVDPIFGTIEDFREMANRAHDLGKINVTQCQA